MSTTHPHTAKAVFFSCIDDRLIKSHATFIKSLGGGAFHPGMAGGGAALINPEDHGSAIKQIVASYKINHITDVYLESHTDCGAYRLAGVTFKDDDDELERLNADLETAATNVRDALRKAGVAEDEITVHIRVVNPAGQLIMMSQPA